MLLAPEFITDLSSAPVFVIVVTVLEMITGVMGATMLYCAIDLVTPESFVASNR